MPVAVKDAAAAEEPDRRGFEMRPGNHWTGLQSPGGRLPALNRAPNEAANVPSRMSSPETIDE
jgi:hypothetical protein